MRNGSSNLPDSSVPKDPPTITKHTKITQEIQKLDLATEKD